MLNPTMETIPLWNIKKIAAYSSGNFTANQMIARRLEGCGPSHARTNCVKHQRLARFHAPPASTPTSSRAQDSDIAPYLARLADHDAARAR